MATSFSQAVKLVKKAVFGIARQENFYKRLKAIKHLFLVPMAPAFLLYRNREQLSLEVASGICFQELKDWPRYHLQITAAVFSPDGRIILTGSADEIVHIWDVKTGILLQKLEGHTNLISKDVFSDELPCCRFREKISYFLEKYGPWDEDTEKLLQKLSADQARIYLVALNPDGSTILTGDDSRACLWDAQNRNVLT